MLCVLMVCSASPAGGPPCTLFVGDDFESGTPGSQLDGRTAGPLTWSASAGATIAAQAVPCRADLDADGLVNGTDITLILNAWNSAGPAGDLNGDGVVNGVDISVVLTLWGPCAPSANNVADLGPAPPLGQPPASALAQWVGDPVMLGAVPLFVSFEEHPSAAGGVSSRTTEIGSLTSGATFIRLAAPIDPSTGGTGPLIVNGFSTQKAIDPGVPTQIIVEFAPGSPIDPTTRAVRVLVRDPLTVAQFGPDPVEIFPAGTPAPDPFLISGVGEIDFARFTGDGRRLDALAVASCPP
ncbi:MAG: hypothetical protein D6693_06200 [Planctomycetota bacterium]|nr:MAG: hypothetical protein D6693_06200 [Planctomycetota bacterium]